MRPVFKLIRLQTILGALLGLFCGLLYSVGGLVLDTLVSLNWINSTETPGLGIGTILAFGALIGMPLIFGLAGGVLGAIEGLLYQLAQKWLGPFKLY